MGSPLRLLVFDRTCRGPRGLPGLSQAWAAGRHLYRGLGRLDAGFGAASWAEALDWLAEMGAPRPIAEIQFWGHGRFGEARIAGETLDAGVVAPGHPQHERLRRVRDRLLRGHEGLFWFRTCETFGGQRGHAFARAFTDFLGCRTAGHSHVIGVLQSGLHSLLPGATPGWPADEGVRGGSGAPSSWKAPNTITCLHGAIPPGY